MAKKGALLFALLIIFSFGFIITVPIGVLSVNLSWYGIINYDNSFEFTPDAHSSVERLNLDVDIGNIEIKYKDPPVDYFVRIDVDFEMFGPGLGGKGYLDYFNITRSEPGSSPMYFSMKLLSNNSIRTLLKDVSILVNLRKGVIFDISANIESGNVDINVPYKVQVSNLNVNIAQGNFSLNLYKCIIEGNITGILNSGRMFLKSLDAEYTQKCKWTLTSDELKIKINQSNPLGANVTGTLSSRLNIPTYLTYNDSTSEVGAKFTLDDYNYPDIWIGTAVGFYDDGTPGYFDSVGVGINRFSSKTIDFPTNYNYILSFYIEGILDFDLYSS